MGRRCLPYCQRAVSEWGFGLPRPETCPRPQKMLSHKRTRVWIRRWYPKKKMELGKQVERHSIFLEGTHPVQDEYKGNHGCSRGDERVHDSSGGCLRIGGEALSAPPERASHLRLRVRLASPQLQQQGQRDREPHGFLRSAVRGDRPATCQVRRTGESARASQSA